MIGKCGNCFTPVELVFAGSACINHQIEYSWAAQCPLCGLTVMHTERYPENPEKEQKL